MKTPCFLGGGNKGALQNPHYQNDRPPISQKANCLQQRNAYAHLIRKKITIHISNYASILHLSNAVMIHQLHL